MTINQRKLFKVQTMGAFEAQALAEDQRLRSYRVSYGGWRLLTAQARENLLARNAESLKAINYTARVAFTRFLLSELDSVMKTANSVYFVTLISDKHAGRIGDLSAFDLKAYRKWVRDALGELDYIGLVDLAYYYRSPFLLDGNRPHASWHCHLIVWGAARNALQKAKRLMNATERAFVPGALPFHYEHRSRSELLEMVLYMAKGIVGEYSAFPVKREEVDLETGEITLKHGSRWKNQKRKISAPGLIRAINCMGRASFKDVCVANGAGKSVKRAALKKAHKQIQLSRIKKDRQIELALGFF